MNKTIVKDDLLFHSVHGLCRVASVTQSAPSKEVSYSLLPVSSNRAKVRFTIPESSFEGSGFGKLVSAKEANAILDYFKTGNKNDSECGSAWLLAATIYSESGSKEFLKDARKRQRVEQSVRGLVGELAYVLKSTLREIAEKIKRNLGAIPNINPLVLAALANVDSD